MGVNDNECAVKRIQSGESYGGCKAQVKVETTPQNFGGIYITLVIARRFRLAGSVLVGVGPGLVVVF